MSSHPHVAFFGDVHGERGAVDKVIKAAAERGITTVFSLGDFGVWPGAGGSRFLEKLNTALTFHSIDLYVVDGNHDWHPKLSSVKRDAAGRGILRDRIRHLPRGHRWEINDVTFAALGGAVSVDRNLRTEGKDWWPEETISEEDAARVVSGGEVDVLLTHDAPSGVDLHLPSGHGPWFTPDVERDSNAHRVLLRNVVEAVKPKFLLHGHYHKHIDQTLETHAGITRVIGLSEEHTATNLLIATVGAPDGEPLVNLEYPFTAGHRAEVLSIFEEVHEPCEHGYHHPPNAHACDGCCQPRVP